MAFSCPSQRAVGGVAYGCPWDCDCFSILPQTPPGPRRPPPRSRVRGPWKSCLPWDLLRRSPAWPNPPRIRAPPPAVGRRPDAPATPGRRSSPGSAYGSPPVPAEPNCAWARDRSHCPSSSCHTGFPYCAVIPSRLPVHAPAAATPPVALTRWLAWNFRRWNWKAPSWPASAATTANMLLCTSIPALWYVLSIASLNLSVVPGGLPHWNVPQNG